MEINDIKDKEQLKYFLLNENNGSNSFFRESYFKKVFYSFYNDIIEYHKNNYDIDFKFSQKIYNYINDVNVFPKCIECGKNVSFCCFKEGYNKYCSHKCAIKSEDRCNKISSSHKSRTEEELEKSNKKRKETCIEKYGVDAVSRLDEFKDKIKTKKQNRTVEEKQETRDKIKNKWNNKTSEELEEIKTKRNETLANKTLDDKRKTQEKRISTYIKNYGSLENLYTVRGEKTKQTNIEKYGVENTFQLDKVTNLNIDRWKAYRKNKFDNVIEYVKQTEIYICSCTDKMCDLCKNKTYSISVKNYLNRLGYGFSLDDICTIKNPIGETFKKSYIQKLVFLYVKSIYDGEVVYNDRKTLLQKTNNKLELDIFIPDKNIAIEVNGDFWHMNPKQYNKNDYNPITGETAEYVWEQDNYKKNLCNSIGLNLITVWESDWKSNTDKEKELLKNILS